MIAEVGLLFLAAITFIILWAEGTLNQKSAMFTSAALIIAAMLL